MSDPSLAAQYHYQALEKLHDGQLEEAHALIQRAIALASNPVARAMSVSLLGEVEGQSGNIELAEARFEEATAVFEEAGHLRDAGVSYNQWAALYSRAGCPEEACEHLIRAAQCFHQVGDEVSLQTVTQSFRNYLAQCGEVLAASMGSRWVLAELPGAEEFGKPLIDLLGKTRVQASPSAEAGRRSWWGRWRRERR